MTGESHTTTDHDTIRHWIESRGGRPATVRGTERSGEQAGLLRVDFPERGEQRQLQPLEWSEFFQKFEESELAFLYQSETKDGNPSRFFKFVARH